MVECAAGMRAWACVVETLHHANGFSTSAEKQLRLLGHTVFVWQQVKLQAASNPSLDLLPIIEGGMDHCPACWRECAAFSLDACLGLRYAHILGPE